MGEKRDVLSKMQLILRAFADSSYHIDQDAKKSLRYTFCNMVFMMAGL